MTALVFSGRMQFLNKDGTLTREATAFFQELVNRSGGTTGTIIASSIVNTPNGSIAAVNVQAAIDELDTEKASTTALTAGLAGKENTGTAAAAVAAHVALADPHAQYALESAIGTIASQAANNVAITGGAIDGTPIGATTQGTGKFTTVEATATVKSGYYLVAALPAAATAGPGGRAFVADATATTFLSVVAGGGANKVPVVSDGTNWLIG